MNHSMKKLSYFAFTICLVFGTLTANAQFNKPLQSASQRKTSNVAKYNVGISGGLSLTHWIHTGGLENDFEQPIADGLPPVLIYKFMKKELISVSNILDKAISSETLMLYVPHSICEYILREMSKPSN